MSANRSPNLIVVAPAAIAALIVGVLIATLLALSSLIGGAAAASGCGPGAGDPRAVPGAPAALQPIFTAAARRYGLGASGPSILAGLTSVESGFGQNMGPSSAGAIGWTQFMPATWARYGVDANGDGKRDPYNAADAIFSTARLLRASGAPRDWYRALFAYNHADWYVTTVLDRAKQLAAGSAPMLTTAPATTLVIGDSMEVGTLPELHRLIGGGVVGDATISRSSAAGIAVLRSRLAGGDYPTIVFDLGTNDPDARMLRRSLAALTSLARQRRVVLATVNSPFAQRAKNRLLTNYVRSHPDAVLIPWQRVSRHLHLADGIHGGYRTRARLLARALGTTPGAPAEACPGLDAPPTDVRRVSTPGRIVPIPGQAGQAVDERILPDVLYLISTYRLTITAGYAPTGHAAGGEHPLGLAVDIVPGPGGSWDDVDRLAHWAEPTQNAPRPPFRWVGYDGDPGHGRGNHLHLSWNHAPAPSRRPPVAWVQVMRGGEPG